MSNCKHQWKSYVGLNEAFDYCAICDIKKDDKIHGPTKVYLPGSKYEVTLPQPASTNYISPGILDLDDDISDLRAVIYDVWRDKLNEQAKRNLRGPRS